MPPKLQRGWRKLKHAYWNKLVRRVKLKAFLVHEIKLDPDGEDWETRQWLSCVETKELVRRGAKVNVWVADVPLPEGQKDHWTHAYDGEQYIQWESFRKLRTLVEDAEYERSKRRREGRELRVKYVGAIAAILAALAGFANLYITAHKK